MAMAAALAAPAVWQMSCHEYINTHIAVPPGSWHASNYRSASAEVSEALTGLLAAFVWPLLPSRYCVDALFRI